MCEQNNLKCPMCGKEAKNEKYLEYHIQVIHTKQPEKPNLKEIMDEDGDIDGINDSFNDENWKKSREDEKILEDDKEDNSIVTFNKCKTRAMVQELFDFRKPATKRKNDSKD